MRYRSSLLRILYGKTCRTQRRDWQSFPDYAAIVNSREQAGANDISAMLLRDLGVDSEPNVCPDRLLSISPVAGTCFLAFQREPVPGKEKRGQGTCLNR